MWRWLDQGSPGKRRIGSGNSDEEKCNDGFDDIGIDIWYFAICEPELSNFAEMESGKVERRIVGIIVWRWFDDVIDILYNDGVDVNQEYAGRQIGQFNCELWDFMMSSPLLEAKVQKGGARDNWWIK